MRSGTIDAKRVTDQAGTKYDGFSHVGRTITGESRDSSNSRRRFQHDATRRRLRDRCSLRCPLDLRDRRTADRLRVDLLTAALLFIVLGWRWLILPGLIMEAIPGFGVFPFWLVVVAAIVVWGTARPKVRGESAAPLVAFIEKLKSQT